MELWELAFCCWLYGQLTTYDATLDRLYQRVAPALDPWVPAHRAALFEWLNSWGCRQFAKEHHATTASQSLVAWAQRWLPKLPPVEAQLIDLSADELRGFAAAYDALQTSTASYRDLPSGARATVRYGPTGAAKVLFILRPRIAPPWDEAIRARFGSDAAAYQRYLMDVADTLRSLARDAGVEVSELPKLVGRPGSTPPKLIDEYNWVVISQGLRPPRRAQLLQWCEWAARSPR